jgi:hypothetical protein
VASGLARAQGAAIEDASLSGQRTRQIMEQQNQSFPLELEHRKEQTKHLKKITEDADKVMVPGFGLMTPSQLSAHQARMDRIKTLQEKTDPARGFETELQKNYGLSIANVLDATKGKFIGQDPNDAKKTKEFIGVPFVDATGRQVASHPEILKELGYTPQNPTVWARVPPNDALVPAHLWPQVVSKSKSFSKQLNLEDPNSDISQLNRSMMDIKREQAQKVIAIYNAKPADQRTADDEAMYQAAQQFLSGK